jgi:hypothetical protein
MNALDLATPPELLLPIGLVLCSISALLWLHEHRSAVARARRRVRAWLNASRTDLARADARAEGHAAAGLGHRVRRDHGGRRGHDGDRAARPLALTDDEVVALARYLDLSARRMSGMTIAEAYGAISKVMRAANVVLHADRAGRR